MKKSRVKSLRLSKKILEILRIFFFEPRKNNNGKSIKFPCSLKVKI